MATSEELKDLPPEVIKQLMDSGAIDARQARLALKLKEANAVRNAGGPKGTRGIGRSNIYVAANPLEHLVSGIRKYKAGKAAKGFEEKQGTLDEEDALARQKYWDIVSGGRTPSGASETILTESGGGGGEQYGPPQPVQDAAASGVIGGGVQGGVQGALPNPGQPNIPPPNMNVPQVPEGPTVPPIPRMDQGNPGGGGPGLPGYGAMPGGFQGVPNALPPQTPEELRKAQLLRSMKQMGNSGVF